MAVTWLIVPPHKKFPEEIFDVMSDRKKKSSAEALDFIIPGPCRHGPGGTEKHQLAAP